ncbi:hypothetical protein NGRA_2993 [Nosema granulosis]|uniref:Uncharacterized protein n=1 Tax=Nosema granulosis TaxID=83296 RepID=A0A9P6GWN8_9MICR|nr:hypothetical protein NGRA_2993 [Nosema granulosis]
MLTKQFFKLATENIGNSFIFGTTTKFLSHAIKKDYSLRIPDDYDLRSCLRTGSTFAKHALVYSLNVCVLEKIGLPSMMLHLSATFLTAFQLALRNGVSYASRTATISSITSFLKSIVFKK